MKNFTAELKNGRYLLTCEAGNHVFLDEFPDFEKEEVVKKLEENFLILTENNVKQYVEKLRKKKSFLFSGPSLNIVVVTLRCDQKCTYCHASSKGLMQKEYDMPLETADKVARLISQGTVEFQGGEPLANFSAIKQIVAGTKNVNYVLVSNLALMNEEILKFLMDRNFGICTSLDGPEFLHNKHRAKYKETIYWIKRVNEEYQKRGIEKRVGALLTLTKDSLEYPREIVDEYVRQGIEDVDLRKMDCFGRSKKEYTAEEFIEFWKKAMDYIMELNTKGIRIFESKTKVMLKKILFEEDPGHMDLRSPCGAVIGQILYNYDGRIFTCDEGRMVGEDIFNIGNVDQQLSEITTSDDVNAVISASINDSYCCVNCVYKPYCGICPVVNYQEFGSLIGHISESDWCKINKAQFDYVFENLEKLKKWVQ